MAEENDQNAVQPQNDEQQTVPMPPVDAEQTQPYAGEPYATESATEPIDVQSGIENQPTAAMPVANDDASAESATATGDTPDYASAAGERTVVGGSTQDAPAQQYRPAPEYGAYGPVPTQPTDGTAAANGTANGTASDAPNMLRSRNMAHTGRLRSSRSGLAILSSEIRMWVEISRTISRTRNRITVIRS